MKSSTALDIAQAAPGAADASPEHKRFRSLLARIEQARERLQAWQRELPAFARLHAEHVAPIETRFHALRSAWAFELEQLLLSRRWSRAEQDTLARMVCELSGRLLVEGHGGAAARAELKALHDRHSDLGFDDQRAQAVARMRESIEHATGLDLGGADGDGAPGSLDELLARARAAQAEAETAREQQAPPPRRPRAPSRSAAERRAEADAAQATQTLREVYRKLAAALHPDRAPAGASDGERAERTTQMARANAAYAAGDLLALLQLQLEFEHLDVAQAGRLAAAQLRHFNRVLAEQLKEIEHDIAEREQMFCATYRFSPERRPDPSQLAPFLKQDAQELLAAEAGLREQRRALLDEQGNARRLLKRIEAEFRLLDRFDDGGF